MSQKRLLALIVPLMLAAGLIVTQKVTAYRSGCHTDHSCPSDTASYICGDKGSCGQCPDNDFCLAGQKRIPDPKPQDVSTASEAAKVKTNAVVLRVVDGDTVVVRLDSEPDREFKIRMLGVNTPESVDPRRPVECFGKEASAFTKKALEGKRVQLAADPQADEVDKYGRLLRNIILEDGTDFNAKLVSDGYAQAYLSFPLDLGRKALLRSLEKEAKAAQRGLWNPQTCLNEK